MLINEVPDLTHLINGQSSIPDHVRNHLTGRAQWWPHVVYRNRTSALIARPFGKATVTDEAGGDPILTHHIEHGE
jgi:hypothetical protein